MCASLSFLLLLGIYLTLFLQFHIVGVGVIATKFKKGQEEIDRVKSFCIVAEDDEILVITAKGIMVRQKVSDISSQGRSATGVTIQKVDSGDSIASVSLVPTYEEQDDADE